MKNAQFPNNEEPSALDSVNSSLRLTPRQERALNALMCADFVSREAIDRIAGASNGPHVIMELRRNFLGRDGIETIRVKVRDRDGRQTNPGRYRLTEAGRRRWMAMGRTLNG